ncbi:metal ABC transporter solute-binding protein, Zn/Mn family [Bogoriella caseilytica]|uniref:ABC-type Zn uptake system ZnuABC Zn-binding protein ZnuA n=1 Tax=Bogoriella caseilytica TaxID=56055 RepID=A0A3N2BAI1_9MICO|nr:zinc ABC transporter substrate-binding protein [Bogoriella caseilytica]ROR72281.1 ABC-type Zn uptake system ZnuABC Zn-binding protein ZnuA [Bogoriella caseilytica]
MGNFGAPKSSTLANRSRLAAFLSAGVLLAACASPSEGQDPGSSGTDDADRPLVLTTFTVLADMAQQVAGEHAEVESITGVGQEIHGYEPAPDDLRRAAEADLLIANGLHLEDWLDQLLIDVDAPRVTASDGVDTMAIQPEDGSAPGEAINPHAWMSPAEGQVYLANIAAALSDIDPDRAAEYQANAAAYISELETVESELRDALEDVPASARVLVTCEGAFSYLARDLGLEEAYLWPVNAEYEATPQQVRAVIERVRADDIPAVFCESTVSDSGMQQVVAETEAELAGILYVDSLSGPDGPVPGYLDMLQHTAETIAVGLAGDDD